jgi:hypothetical protein
MFLTDLQDARCSNIGRTLSASQSFSSARWPASATSSIPNLTSASVTALIEQVERLAAYEFQHLAFGFGAAQLRKDIRCRGASPSQGDLADRHRCALRVDLDIVMRGSLHRGNQRFAGEIPLEAAEFFGGR